MNTGDFKVDSSNKSILEQWQQMGSSFAKLMEENQAQMTEFLQQAPDQSTQAKDPLNITPAF